MKKRVDFCGTSKANPRGAAQRMHPAFIETITLFANDADPGAERRAITPTFIPDVQKNALRTPPGTSTAFRRQPPPFERADGVAYFACASM